jgi:hypothetical protein
MLDRTDAMRLVPKIRTPMDLPSEVAAIVEEVMTNEAQTVLLSSTAEFPRGQIRVR